MADEQVAMRRVTGPDEHGSVYVYFQPHKKAAVGRTVTLSDNVNIDYDHDGKLYGIEILGVAKRQLATLQSVSAAPQEGKAALDEMTRLAQENGEYEHSYTEACGFDRNASLTEDTYVCTCGYRAPRGDGGEVIETIRQACLRDPLFRQFSQQDFWHAHYVDIVWRYNGEDRRYQADWLKDIWYALRGRLDCATPPAATDGFVRVPTEEMVAAGDAFIEANAKRGWIPSCKDIFDVMFAAAPQSGKKEDGCPKCQGRGWFATDMMGSEIVDCSCGAKS